MTTNPTTLKMNRKFETFKLLTKKFPVVLKRCLKSMTLDRIPIGANRETAMIDSK